MTRLKGEVEKGWGSETIFATNALYCGKLLNFDRGHKCSRCKFLPGASTR